MARLTQHLANSTGTRIHNIYLSPSHVLRAGTKEELRLPRNIDSPSVQAFILQNRQAMLEFVQALTRPSLEDALVVPVLSVPSPALWCCQRCLLVNRWVF